MSESPKFPEPFTRGVEYRSVRDFTYYGFTFTLGEILTFTHQGYSRHDEGVVYEFQSAGGVRKDWILYDGEPADLARQYFEKA
jgi:hypothetical protein